MKLGKLVDITRGSDHRKMPEPGCIRVVVGIVTAQIGNDYEVVLIQPDPLDTVGWKDIGSVGRWPKSCIRKHKHVWEKIGDTLCYCRCGRYSA